MQMNLYKYIEGIRRNYEYKPGEDRNVSGANATFRHIDRPESDGPCCGAKQRLTRSECG